MNSLSRSLVSSRHSLAIKAGGAAALIALADVVVFEGASGSVLAGFALAWMAVLVIARPAVRANRAGIAALLAAAVLVLSLLTEPGPLAAVLFLTAIGSAALLPRHVYDHAGRWCGRLIVLGIKAPFGPLIDLHRTTRMRSRHALRAEVILLNLVVPLVGGALFLALFASANPVLGGVLGAVELPDMGDAILHMMLWGAVLVVVWPTLRPRALVLARHQAPLELRLPDPPVMTMLLALFTFNAVFALQNALDIIFLWSGAPLPNGVTLAEYAHQGAYTLIATALLAGLFVLVALRPRSPAAQTPLVRALVLGWVAQNLLLVASSVLRLLDYIDAFSLTELRIAALIWMGLVATGLGLICWRFMTGRSAAWLINANTLAAAIVLTGSSFADFGAIAARWNVDHLDDPNRIDLCYLETLDDAALLPLIDLRAVPMSPEMQDKVIYLGNRAHADLAAQQSDWRHWTLRGARRLARAEALLAYAKPQIAQPAPYGRYCGGNIVEPPPPPVIAADPPPPPTPPLTQTPIR